MKKEIGSELCLYPTPLVIVGAMVNEKPNWILIGHTGIIDFSTISISLNKRHYTNQGIKENKAFSINLVDESFLKEADYTGIVSGNKTSKENLFKYNIGTTGAPMIEKSLLSIDCKLVDIYETDTFENFIAKVENNYADESILDENNKIDYDKFKPILFEKPSWKYLKTGEIVGKCRKMGE